MGEIGPRKNLLEEILLRRGCHSGTESNDGKRGSPADHSVQVLFVLACTIGIVDVRKLLFGSAKDSLVSVIGSVPDVVGDGGEAETESGVGGSEGVTSLAVVEEQGVEGGETLKNESADPDPLHDIALIIVSQEERQGVRDLVIIVKNLLYINDQKIINIEIEN